MKNILVLLLIAIPSMFYAQSEHFDQRNAIRASPVEFGKAEFQIGYERYFVDRKASILIVPSIILKDSPQQLKEGFQIESQFRFYLSHLKSSEGKAFLGFHNLGLYTGVYARYVNYNEEYDFMWWDNDKQETISNRFEKSVNAGEAGVLLGVQFDITKRIFLDFFAGGGIRYPKRSDTKDDFISPVDYYDDISVFDIDYKGVKPKIGFQMGFTF